MKVERLTQHDQKDKVKDYLMDVTRNVNVEVLEQVADHMLANPAINSKMLPDNIEKQIYVNCMVVRKMELLCCVFAILFLMSFIFTL